MSADFRNMKKYQYCGDSILGFGRKIANLKASWMPYTSTIQKVDGEIYCITDI